MLDLVVVGLYLLITVGLAARFVRQGGTAEGFSLGSGQIPTWAIGLSLLGTFVSSISFVGNPGKAYSDNWAPLGFALVTPLVAFFAGRYFVPLYRGRGHVSAYQFLEERFGYWARAYGSASFLLVMLGRVSVILYLVAIVIAPMLGLPVPMVIIVTGIIVTVYTLMGGMEAVIWTDVVQVIVMLGGALWCLAAILLAIPGGAAQVYQIASDAGGKFALGEYSLRWDGQTFLGVFCFAILANIQNFGTDQNYVQRYLTVKSDREAVRALVIGTLPFIPMTALFLMIGTGLFAFYRVNPALLPAGVTGDMVFPHFIRTQLPPGVSGLLVAAILAAAMSTLSSNINCMATVFVEDYCRRLWMPALNPASHIRLLRISGLVLGMAGTMFGLTMMGFRSVLDLFWEICSMVGSGLLGLFLLAAAFRNISPAAAQLAAIAGIVTVAVVKLGLRADALVAGSSGTFVLIAVAFVYSRITAFSNQPATE
ncbi:MAG: sodium/solute symporter [Bryobacterales bacterium]|nr:sodium/solute symporter [Bryobacterales bacterium]